MSIKESADKYRRDARPIVVRRGRLCGYGPEFT